MLALERGRRRLALWIAMMLVLAFTRDSAVVVAAAVAWLALRRPSRRRTAVAATGALAALLPSAIFGAPLRVSMAYTLNGFFVPDDQSGSFVAHHYLRDMRSLEKNDVRYLLVLPNYTAFRLELVFLPVVAVGIALVLSSPLPVELRRRLPLPGVSR